MGGGLAHPVAPRSVWYAGVFPLGPRGTAPVVLHQVEALDLTPGTHVRAFMVKLHGHGYVGGLGAGEMQNYPRPWAAVDGFIETPGQPETSFLLLQIRTPAAAGRCGFNGVRISYQVEGRSASVVFPFSWHSRVAG